MELLYADLTHDRMAELKEAFSLFDYGGTGSITTDELKVILMSLVPDFSQDDMARIIANIDADHSGSIEFAEFVAVMVEFSGSESASRRSSASGVVPNRDMINLFSALDPDNSGVISKSDFLRTLSRGQEGLSAAEQTELWDDAVRLNCVRKDRVHYKKFVTKLVAECRHR